MLQINLLMRIVFLINLMLCFQVMLLLCTQAHAEKQDAMKSNHPALFLNTYALKIQCGIILRYATHTVLFYSLWTETVSTKTD